MSSLAKKYNWQLFPRAEKFLNNEINRFFKNSIYTRKLAKRMLKDTSTNLIDWIDHIRIPEKRAPSSKLKKIDFHRVMLRAPKGTKVYKNPDSIFPAILTSKEVTSEICLKTEYIDDCVKKLGKTGNIKGPKLSPLRKATITVNKNNILSAIQRRGSNNFIINEKPKDIKAYKKAFKSFESRKRHFQTDEKGLDHTKKLIKKHLKSLSSSRTADAFFRAERKYWQSRNKAGRIQHKRQNKLGLGWGNHDHHTYRSSRKNFTKLIEILEILGYECRERFFAGSNAGWGAQVLEHPQCDIVIFADLDISEAEKNTDFAHKPVANKHELGTVGLWIALHGESILQSGMHHLEARFDHKRLTKDLKKQNIHTMKPFSNFKFLKQAFTEGERWKIEPKRLHTLLKNKQITTQQAKQFMRKGAIGSHMENLERKQGYKGFNQHSVAAIIKATNPLKRLTGKHKHHHGA